MCLFGSGCDIQVVRTRTIEQELMTLFLRNELGMAEKIPVNPISLSSKFFWIFLRLECCQETSSSSTDPLRYVVTAFKKMRKGWYLSI